MAARSFFKRRKHTHLKPHEIANLLGNNFEQFVAFIPTSAYRNGYCVHLLDFADDPLSQQYKFVALCFLAQVFRMQHGSTFCKEGFSREPDLAHCSAAARLMYNNDPSRPTSGTRPGAMLVLEKIVVLGRCVGWLWFLYTNQQGQEDEMAPMKFVDDETAPVAPPPPPAPADVEELDPDDPPPLEPVVEAVVGGRRKRRAKPLVKNLGEWVLSLATRSKSSSTWMAGLLGGYKGTVTASAGPGSSRGQTSLQTIWQDNFLPLCTDPVEVANAFRSVAGVDGEAQFNVHCIEDKESASSVWQLLTLTYAINQIGRSLPNWNLEAGTALGWNCLTQRGLRLWCCNDFNDPVAVPGDLHNTYYYSDACACNPFSLSRTRMPDFDDSLDHLNPKYVQILVDNPGISKDEAMQMFRGDPTNTRMVMKESINMMTLMDVYRKSVPSNLPVPALERLLQDFAGTLEFLLSEASNIPGDSSGSKYSWLRTVLQEKQGVFHLFAHKGSSGCTHPREGPTYSAEGQFLEFMFKSLAEVWVVSNVQMMVITALLACLDSPRDTDMLNLTTVFYGPPAMGKSLALEILAALSIPSTVVHITYGSKMSLVTSEDWYGVTFAHDEVEHSRFGVDEKAKVDVGMVVRACLKRSAGSTTLAECLFKQQSSTRTQTTATCYIDKNRNGKQTDGRATEVVTSLRKCSYIYCVNIPTVLFPDSVLSRIVPLMTADNFNHQNHRKETHSKSALTASMKATAIPSLWAQPFTDEFRGMQALSSILCAMIRARVAPEVDKSALAVQYLITCKLLNEYGCDTGNIRDYMKTNGLAETITIVASLQTVFGKGIGAPDPSIPFSMTHLMNAVPFCIVKPTTGLFVMEMMNMGMSPTGNRILHVLREHAFEIPDGQHFPTRDEILEGHGPQYKFSVDIHGYAILPNFKPLCDAAAELAPRREKNLDKATIITETIRRLASWIMRSGLVVGDEMEIVSTLLGLFRSKVKAESKPRDGGARFDGSTDATMTGLKFGLVFDDFGGITSTNLPITALCIYAPLLDAAPNGGPGADVFSALLPPRPPSDEWVEGVLGDQELDEFSVFPPDLRALPDAPVDFEDPFGKRPKFETSYLRGCPNETYTGLRHCDLTDEARHTVLGRKREDMVNWLRTRHLAARAESDKLRQDMETLQVRMRPMGSQRRNAPAAVTDQQVADVRKLWEEKEAACAEITRLAMQINESDRELEAEMFSIPNHGTISLQALEVCLDLGIITEAEYHLQLAKCGTQPKTIFAHRCTYVDLARQRLIKLGLATEQDAHLHIAYPPNTQRVLDNYAACARAASALARTARGESADASYHDFLFFAVTHFVLLAGYNGGLPGERMLASGQLAQEGRIKHLVDSMGVTVEDAAYHIKKLFTAWHNIRRGGRGLAQSAAKLRSVIASGAGYVREVEVPQSPDLGDDDEEFAIE